MTQERKSRYQHLNIVSNKINKLPNVKKFIGIVFKIECFTQIAATNWPNKETY